MGAGLGKKIDERRGYEMRFQNMKTDLKWYDHITIATYIRVNKVDKVEGYNRYV